MSSDNHTTSASGGLPLALVLNYSEFVTPSITFMMIDSTMGAVLFSMLLALFFFSTPSLTRKPIFVLNVIAVLLGIAYAIVALYVEIHTIKHPAVPLNPQVIIAIGVINGITPTFVDSILLLRLCAISPFHTTPRLVYLVVLGFPVLLKVGRLTNCIIYVHSYARIRKASIAADTASSGASIIATSHLPSVKIEWICQVVDDVYCSSVFLFQMYCQGAFFGPTSGWSTAEKLTAEKLKTLFWICASTFVFPVVLGVVQVAIYLNSPQNYLLALYVENVNFHFTIMGVIFATVWAAEGRWIAERHLDEASGDAGYLSRWRVANLSLDSTIPPVLHFKDHRPHGEAYELSNMQYSDSPLYSHVELQ
ncbi:hypothetical protein FA95DRAFT_1601761 [Auriscalpium vulgare]|uniref:Uncharacterized protein n=1 Tax=Auriscalpium vulgare TaxID=40419 RepID=A0ACB8S9D4_9AGAM|nr:hypothetical protein FA95DRAFT_1601761 [Auriscalpium vulgare]